MSYEEDLEVNEHNLDSEWKKQPANYITYSKLAAEADADKKRAKEKAETVFSERFLFFKKQAAQTQTKTTEAEIKAHIQLDPEYVKVKEELITAEYDFNMLNAAVKAFDQKKAALENLVKLLIGGFYAEPKQDTASAEKRSEMQGEKQKEALDKKKKARIARRAKRENDST